MRTLAHLRSALAAAAAATLLAGAAQALCAAPSPGLSGSWYNEDPATRGITRAELRFTCGDVVLNGRRAPTGWMARLYGSCTPSDCAFPGVVLERDAAGWFSGRIEQGWATRSVTLVPIGGARVALLMRTDFRDPGRRDYNSVAMLEPRG